MLIPKPPSSGYEYIDFYFVLGDGWAGNNMNIDLFYARASNAGDVNINFEIFRLRDGTLYSSSSNCGATTYSAIAAPNNDYQIKNESRQLSLSTGTWSDGYAVKLRIARYNNANDTHPYSMAVATVGVYVT